MDYYATIEAEEKEQATRLAWYLMKHYSPESVIDLGCATGLYLKPFFDEGLWVRGYELDSGAVVRAPEFVIQEDITDPLFAIRTLSFPADLALCLEVFEHIPEDKIHEAASSLAASSDLIVFSAARPGQGGEGHINCQPQDYWRGLMAAHGFKRDIEATGKLIMFMKEGYHLGWFTQNVMVLRRVS